MLRKILHIFKSVYKGCAILVRLFIATLQASFEIHVQLFNFATFNFFLFFFGKINKYFVANASVLIQVKLIWFSSSQTT